MNETTTKEVKMETYKSEILNQEYNLITYKGKKVVKLVCSKCNGQGTLTQHWHIFNGQCFQCEGRGFKTRTLQTIKKWEREEIKKENEYKEYQELQKYIHTVKEVSEEEVKKYELSKIVCLQNGLQEITGVVENIYGTETPYGFVVKMVLNVNNNLLWVNRTKALEDVNTDDTITIELEVNMFNADERKGSGKAGRRKLTNHIKA